MTHPTPFKNLKKRSLVLQSTRDFFISNNFLEVETPALSSALIPEAHIDPPMAEGHYLQASPELYMKRLLSRGAGPIFQICKCFRKAERGQRHLPELTLLEWYVPGQDYIHLMDNCQGLIRHIAHRLGMGDTLRYQNRHIDLNPPFDRISVDQAFKKFTATTAQKALEAGTFDEIISFEIEPMLGLEHPCFLYDYPAPMASLAKLHPKNPDLAQRFELYICGIELANAFTELTDPVTQRQRFETENKLRKAAHLAPIPLPERFLTDLETMPEAAGIALGMDRLVMLFCNAQTIDEVVTFTPEMM